RIDAHLYYTFDDARVIVRTLWGARRGSRSSAVGVDEDDTASFDSSSTPIVDRSASAEFSPARGAVASTSTVGVRGALSSRTQPSGRGQPVNRTSRGTAEPGPLRVSRASRWPVEVLPPSCRVRAAGRAYRKRLFSGVLARLYADAAPART